MNSCVRFLLLSLGVLALSMTSNVYSYSSIAKGLGTKADPIQITTCHQLQDISKNLSADYVLDNDIDCSDTKNWNGGAGFSPLGDFGGTLDGNNHIIRHIFMDRPTDVALGLFSSSSNLIKNLTLQDEKIVGMINPIDVPGSAMGGLVSYNAGIIQNVSVEGDYTSNATWNGVVAGRNEGNITNSSGHGQIQGVSNLGGLVGFLQNGTVSYCYSDATVIGTSSTLPLDHVVDGGLVGTSQSHIDSSFATGNVTGYGTSGGLAASSYPPQGHTAGIRTSFATGDVEGVIAGGLVGQNIEAYFIDNFSTGHVTGSQSVGGLIALNINATVTDSYYNIDTTGQSDTGKGTPVHTKQMFSKSTFNNWDFTNTWKITDGHDYPHLQWETVPFTIHIMPIATQNIQTPFAIDVIANDPTFNGRIDFNMDRGDLDTKYVYMVNGEWTGPIILDTPGLRNQLFVRWDQVGNEEPQNSSNLFTVNESSGSLSSDASVVGVVTDSNSQPLANVSVALYANDPDSNPNEPIVYSAVTDVAGGYTISNALPGDYFARFTLAGYLVDTQTTALAAGQRVTLDSMLSMPSSAGKVPVLLVPGMMGSTIPGTLIRVYPRLPATQVAWNSGKLALLNPQWQVGWSALSKAFQAQGYVLGRTLFKVPYDWTLSVPSIRDNYLRPWINEAKRLSGQNQVDIVAHSMGGLVTRSYIQSADYGKDIRKFAMVGTPNQGATAPYYIWEGGDPKTADQYTLDNNNGIGDGKYFYSNTLDYLMLDRSNEHACKYGWLDRYTPKNCYTTSIYNYINAGKHGLSVGQLMPVYTSALVNKDKTNSIITKQENSLVEAMDGMACHTSDTICRDDRGIPYYFLPASSLLTPDNTGVQTKFFAGYYQQTIGSINVAGTKGIKLYQDGIPNLDPPNYYTDGDGTVLDKSIKFLPNLDYTNARVKHANLIKAFKDQLVSYITGNTVTTQPITDDPSPEIVVSVDGYAVPSLTATHANGRPMIFKDGQEQDDYQLQFSSVGLTNPTAGNYSLKLNSAEGGFYTVSIMYADPSNDTNPIIYQNRFSSLMSTNGSATFTFSFDPASRSVVTLDRSTQSPTDLTVVESTDTKTALTWSDSVGDTNKDVDHYVIYTKGTNKSVYYQIGSSTTKTFTTSFPWSDAPYHDFVVQAVLKNGSSTVLSEPTFYDPDESN